MLSLVLSGYQGMTIKPLVELLDVKRKKRALPTVSEEIHSRVRKRVLVFREYSVQCISML